MAQIEAFPATYKAIQITAPGLLELVVRHTPVPGHGEVLLAVEACGMCGADANAIEGIESGLQLPRVPGHEVVGRILAKGPGVSALWPIGKRVGVGRLGGHCLECEQCRKGQFVHCRNQPITGSSIDGGYAEMLVARSTALVSIPEEMGSAEAAPVLCAGLATFNGLKKSGARAGDLVVIHGIGGLGHLGIQYARKMGFKVVAVGRGDSIAEDAKSLGAHEYLNIQTEDVVSRLRFMGGAQVIMSTVPNGEAVSDLIPGLAPQGKLMLLGVGKEPLNMSLGVLVGGERSIQGAMTGTPFDSEKTLEFSVMSDIVPRFETVSLETAYEAYKRMVSGDVRYRMVLTMNNERRKT